MDITEIVSILEKDNPTAAQTLTDYQTTSNNNLVRIGDLEKDLRTSAEKRDRLKHTIRTATGLTEITEESLTDVLTAGEGQTEVYKKEIEGLQSKLLESASDVDDVSAGYEKTIFGLNLDRVVTMLGAANEVQNSHAYGVVLAELGRGAQLEGSDIVYKNDDGTTIYADGGAPASVKSRYEELRANDDFTYLFKEQYIKGGGRVVSGPTTSSGGETIRRSKISDEEKVKYVAKHGMAAYKQLPY